MFDGVPERGLLMTGPLVVQTIAGRKTCTRRIGERYRKWRKGDRIYIRETWAPMCNVADPHCWCDPGDETHHYTEFRADTIRNGKPAKYAGEWPDDEDSRAHAPRWRSALLMHKWRARLWLELTADVHYEPVRDITEDDAIAEGIENEPQSCTVSRPGCGCPRREFASVRDAFSALWDQINAGRAPGDDPDAFTWARNPEVAVLRYRVISTTGRPAS